MAQALKAMQVKDDIKSGVFKNVYLLYGEEAFLKDFYSNALIKKLIDESAFDFNYKEYNGEKPDYDEVEDFLNAYPFMAERKVILIKNSNLMKKSNENDKEFWAKILSDIPPYAVIVFSEKDVDKRSSIYKEINKNFHAEEFPVQTASALTSWVSRYIGQYQKQMSSDTIEYFLSSCSNSMYILKNELEKLANYKRDSKVITKDDIDKCCCKIPESTVWEMIDDALAGKIRTASKKLSELKYLKHEPIAINAAIFSKYTTYRKEKLLSANFTSREIAAKINQKEYFVKLHLNQIKNLPLEYFDRILTMCANADRRIKQEYADGWAEIEIIFSAMLGTI